MADNVINNSLLRMGLFFVRGGDHEQILEAKWRDNNNNESLVKEK